MCGIFGVIHRNGQTVPDGALLEETGRILGHRGPDSIGVHRGEGVGLVHTRLSLIDLSSRSNQPFWDESQRYALVYNGEIYNFQALRSELEQRGVAFRTTSDTEVLLHGIIQHGVDAFLPRCEGMFAFALWDARERVLTLALDRFGIKPLTVYEDEQVLVFSSEIKAMRPWIPLAPDTHSASAFLAGVGGSTRERSFFQNVVQLTPGTIRQVRSGQRSTSRSFFHISEFWQPSERERLGRLDAAQVVDRFDALLFESVKKHLIADAPVGALCSGGLDSSLVMAMASKVHTNLAIFHANVEGPLSEYEAASVLAKHLRLDMLKVDVRDRDFIEHLPAVLWHYEYPFSHHPNSVPFLLVSRLVRASGVKAILSGEGSDECFLGYSSIAYEDLSLGYRRALARVARLVQRIPKVGERIWPRESGHAALVVGMQQSFERELDRQRVEQRLLETGADVRRREQRSLDWLGYHLRTLLHRNDALGMAASIEARFPYLDHDVVREAVNLPYAYKIRPSLRASDHAHPFLRDKWVVREVGGRYLPRTLSQRRKLGFPVNAYERMTVSPGFFQQGFVADLFRLSEPALAYLLEHSDRHFQMRLLMLEVWGRLFFWNHSQADLTKELFARIAIDPIGA
jgi:asparagine synthase (glutamine-hydrolysing)